MYFKDNSTALILHLTQGASMSILQSVNKHVKTLKEAYNAFNTRDIPLALQLMSSDITWPRAFKGGYVRGLREVGAYWKKQWQEINPIVTPVKFEQMPNSQILVTVHQVIKTPEGHTLADEHVKHLFTFKKNYIQSMTLLRK